MLSLRGGGSPTALAAAYLRTYLEPASANLIASAPEPVLLGGTRLGVRVAYRGDFDGDDRAGPLSGESPRCCRHRRNCPSSSKVR